MAVKYWRTVITKYEHYRDDDNWSCCKEESWEIKAETLNGIHDQILSYIKDETEEDRWGEYVTYSWSDLVFVNEIERVEINDRKDIIGYNDFIAKREEEKKQQEKEKQEMIKNKEFERDMLIYKELQTKYKNILGGNTDEIN